MKLIIKEIISYTSENINYDLRVEDIAKHFGYSKFHFSREFKRLTGFSISEFISSIKIEQSIKLLAKNNKSVLSSQLESGYLSSGTFSSIFNKSTGLNPKKYQQKLLDLYTTLNEFESDQSIFEAPYYSKATQELQRKAFNSCKVKIKVPIDFKRSIVFVGIFKTPIPNHKPIVGKALLNNLECTLDRIPKGEYYLLVCAIEINKNPLSYFLLDNCLRGKVEGKVSFPKESFEEYYVELREPISEDPPILINLPSLLAEVILPKK